MLVKNDSEIKKAFDTFLITVPWLEEEIQISDDEKAFGLLIPLFEYLERGNYDEFRGN